MNRRIFERPTAEQKNLLKATARQDETGRIARENFAKALELPLRKNVLDGDITQGIFESVVLEPGAPSEFPFDLFQGGTSKDWSAYFIPHEGGIPMRHVEGGIVAVTTYPIGNSVDWLLRHARDARFDLVERAMEFLESGIVDKLNRDAWNLIIAAGVAAGSLVVDSAASAGQFTRALVSLTQIAMRRRGGGNSSSVSRTRLTDMYISPEALEDIRAWDTTEVDEVTRREILESGEEGISRLYGVNLHTLDELGEGQIFNGFFSDAGGSFSGGDLEICVGLDLSRSDSFVRPVRQELEIVPDDGVDMRRKGRAGVFADLEVGHAVLDNRRVILGSF